jgi:hypothetical protein
MKKILKVFIVIIITIMAAMFLGIYIIQEPLPEGTSGIEAEATADEMLKALNVQAYRALEEVSWTFRRQHHYVWNKKDNHVKVRWDNNEVHLDLADQNHEVISGEDTRENIDKALAFFYNDSFWLFAPYKVRDNGTERKYVALESGHGLLVTYKCGGVTPGDSYLWILDSNYRPVAWRIWTSNVPLDGLRFEWKEWNQYNGVWIASSHKALGILDVRIDEINLR